MRRFLRLIRPVAAAALVGALAAGCVLVPVVHPGYDQLPPPPNDGSFVLKSFCGGPTRIHLGADPRMPGGQSLVLPPFAVQTLPWAPGANTLWLVGLNDNRPIASVNIPFELRRVYVPSGCFGLRLAPTAVAAPPPPPPPPAVILAPPPPPPAPVVVVPPPPTVIVAPPPPPMALPGTFVVRNGCGGAVRIFAGNDPGLGRGNFFDVGPGQSVSVPWSPGLNVWTVDLRGRGRASVTVPPGTGVVSVAPNCVGLRLGL